MITTERFNALLAGPLHHPMPMFAISRLALALKHVVDATGEAGEKALLEYCDARQERDDGVDEESYDEGADPEEILP
ncbi:MAG: hypothetical protein ACRD1X_12495 [Vicinamibacteria bacterium]